MKQNRALKRYTPKFNVDARGFDCPIPMTATLKGLSRVKPGEHISVQVTDDGYCNDIRSIERLGKLKVVFEQESDFEYFYIVQKPEEGIS